MLARSHAQVLADSEDQVRAGSKFKEEGNTAFQAKKWSLAIKRYHTALLQVKMVGVDPQSIIAGALGPGVTELSEDKEYLRAVVERAQEVKLTCCNNLAACMLKTSNWVKAIKHASNVLEMDASNVKALRRRGQAYYYDRAFEKAIADFSAALELCPDDKELQGFLLRAKEQDLSSDKKLTSMYASMLGVHATH